MPDYRDFINLIHGPVPPRPLPCIWDFFPCHAGAVGSVPNFLDYYFDVEEKLRLQATLQHLLPEALILPGVFPDLGVIVEVSAFGGQITWFKQGATPYPLHGYRHDPGNHPRESAGDDRDSGQRMKAGKNKLSKKGGRNEKTCFDCRTGDRNGPVSGDSHPGGRNRHQVCRHGGP
jgi:hypothetical protein